MTISIKKKGSKKVQAKKPTKKKTLAKKKIVGAEPKGHVSVEVKDSSGKTMKSEGQETLGNVVEADGPTANVGFKAGVTRNMGDFNSVRIDVSLFMPCEPEEQSINATFEFVKAWADKKIDALLKDIGAA